MWCSEARVAEPLWSDLDQTCSLQLECSVLPEQHQPAVNGSGVLGQAQLDHQASGELEQCEFIINRIKLIRLIPPQTIKNKYASKKHGKISDIEQLNSSLIKKLAKPLIKKL